MVATRWIAGWKSASRSSRWILDSPKFLLPKGVWRLILLYSSMEIYSRRFHFSKMQIKDSFTNLVWRTVQWLIAIVQSTISGQKFIHQEISLCVTVMCPARCISYLRELCKSSQNQDKSTSWETTSKRSQVVAKLEDGAFFGEIGLLIESKRTASIQAV